MIETHSTPGVGLTVLVLAETDKAIHVRIFDEIVTSGFAVVGNAERWIPKSQIVSFTADENPNHDRPWLDMTRGTKGALRVSTWFAQKLVNP